MKADYIKNPESHPHYGEVQYDADGNPICHICGKSFPKLGAHIWNGHKIRMREYCKMFGLNVKRGVCSKEYVKKMRDHVYEHYAHVVSENLLKGGMSTRFVPGHEGRTKDKMSEQSRRALSALGHRTGVINLQNSKNHKKHNGYEK